MKNEVTISVITATWNSANYIADCMTSILEQDYKKYEHIIIDGCSEDGTLHLIEQFLGKKSKFISEPDRGIYDAFNKGIRLSSGDIIGFLNADDFYAASDVLSQIAKIFEDPSICAVYGDLVYVNQIDTSKIIRRWKGGEFNTRNLIYGWMPAHPTLYVRREWYTLIGGFDDKFKISADYLSILKLFSNTNFKVAYIPSCLVKMRLGGASNKSITSVLRKSAEDFKALRSLQISLINSVFTLACKNLRKICQFI